MRFQAGLTYIAGFLPAFQITVSAVAAWSVENTLVLYSSIYSTSLFNSLRLIQSFPIFSIFKRFGGRLVILGAGGQELFLVNKRQKRAVFFIQSLGLGIVFWRCLEGVGGA